MLLEVGAGTGSVYLLRWYWWRINAWSEIAAMTTALIVTLGVRATTPFHGSEASVFAKQTLVTTLITTVSWIVVTLVTPAESGETLVNFYRRVRPDVRVGSRLRSLLPRFRASETLDATFVIGSLVVR